MALNINQFAQTTVQGQMDLQFGGSVLSGQVDAAQVTPLVAGQAVAGATTSGGVPKFLGTSAANPGIFGFVSRNLKDISFPASAPMEVAFTDSVMYMTAGAAITRFSSVEYDSTNIRVLASAGINPIVGIALDTAVNLGDLIRVLIKTPAIVATTGSTQEITVTATLAQINAGLVIVPGVTGKRINVVDFIARVTGAFTTGTSVNLQSTNASPVVAVSLLEAALTNGAVLVPGSANTTLGAGFGAPMGTGDGLNIINIGTASAGGTSIAITVTYQQA